MFASQYIKQSLFGIIEPGVPGEGIEIILTYDADVTMDSALTAVIGLDYTIT